MKSYRQILTERLWLLASELRGRVPTEDSQADLIEEIELLVLHAKHEAIRGRARQILADLTPRRSVA